MVQVRATVCGLLGLLRNHHLHQPHFNLQQQLVQNHHRLPEFDYYKQEEESKTEEFHRDEKNQGNWSGEVGSNSIGHFTQMGISTLEDDILELKNEMAEVTSNGRVGIVSPT